MLLLRLQQPKSIQIDALTIVLPISSRLLFDSWPKSFRSSPLHQQRFDNCQSCLLLLATASCCICCSLKLPGFLARLSSYFYSPLTRSLHSQNASLSKHFQLGVRLQKQRHPRHHRFSRVECSSQDAGRGATAGLWQQGKQLNLNAWHLSS